MGLDFFLEQLRWCSMPCTGNLSHPKIFQRSSRMDGNTSISYPKTVPKTRCLTFMEERKEKNCANMEAQEY